MKTVTPTTVLDYYDGIQIFAAQDATGGHYIGTMVGTEGDYGRYLVTGVSPADLHLFRCGEMDLRALLLASPTDERFITVATGKFSDPLRLTAVEEPLEQTAFLPEEGFFLEEEAIEDTPVSEAEAGNQTATPPAVLAGDVSLSEITRDLQSQTSQSVSTQPQRMDTSLTVLKNAVKSVQSDFQQDVAAYPQFELQTAGAILNELGAVAKLITEVMRDVERPIGTSDAANPSTTGLKAGNIKSIKDAHGQTSDAQYQDAKEQARQKDKSFTRDKVRTANPAAPPKAPRKTPRRTNDQQLLSENAKLQQQVDQLTARVSTLENILKARQIPLPM